MTQRANESGRWAVLGSMDVLSRISFWPSGPVMHESRAAEALLRQDTKRGPEGLASAASGLLAVDVRVRLDNQLTSNVLLGFGRTSDKLCLVTHGTIENT
jgi:hypothetical protein